MALVAMLAAKVAVAASEHYYCHGNPLPDELFVDCPLPVTLGKQAKLVARRSLWISGDGALVALALRFAVRAAVPVARRKRVFLYSPAHHDAAGRVRHLPCLTAQRNSTHSRQILTAACNEKVSTELRPGDALLAEWLVA